MARKRFPDTESMIAALRPSYPVYCLRPAVIRARAEWFLDHFPGRVLYAVKCNPHPWVLKYLYEAGLRHFDTASLTEIALVREHFADAQLYFMHPVKGRAVTRNAYNVYGVRHYVIDHEAELRKVLDETGGDGIAIIVRLATPYGGAAIDLSVKFGARPAEAVELLRMIRKERCTAGLCFHVGSQCTSPQAYRTALDLIGTVLTASDAEIHYLDVGGGFPATYIGVEPPPLERFFEEIASGLATLDLRKDCVVMCEPGRALVADGCSLVTQIQLRKEDRLYINDGVYGSLDETIAARTHPPAHLLRPNKPISEESYDYTIMGPTCDSTDVLPFTVRLPADAQEGDWIEFDRMGAYSNATATHFNGFYPETYVEIENPDATA